MPMAPRPSSSPCWPTWASRCGQVAQRRAMLVALASVVVDHIQQHLQTGRVQGPYRHLELGDLPAGPSFSCRTTPTRLIARWPAAPARRSAAGSSGSSSSTRPATARAIQGEPGARRVWRSAPLNRSTPELTARRWNSVRRCGSLSGRRRCGSGSPRATRAPRHQRACACQATHPDLGAGGDRCTQPAGDPAPIGIRLHPETRNIRSLGISCSGTGQSARCERTLVTTTRGRDCRMGCSLSATCSCKMRATSAGPRAPGRRRRV